MNTYEASERQSSAADFLHEKKSQDSEDKIDRRGECWQPDSGLVPPDTGHPDYGGAVVPACRRDQILH